MNNTTTTSRYSVRSESTDSTPTSTLFSYFFPELITVGILYIGLEIINFRFLACTDQVMCNATFFISNSLFHFITKIAEGFSVGLVILCGNYNGMKDYKKSGKILADAFWTTALVGTLVSVLLYLGAHNIYSFFEVPPEIVKLGVPYLRVRSIGVFFGFIYFAIIGFLRAIKSPHIAMYIFMLGAIVYIFFDYALIFGVWGFPAMGLQGSAWASVIQYGVMLSIALIYILLHSDIRKYCINIFSKIELSNITHLLCVSWPIMIDKASLALCPIWLNKMIGCTAKLTSVADGQLMYDSLTVLKTMERVGMLPALAFAQVITYLVSNDVKIRPFRHVKNTIKKVLYISCCLVGVCTFIFCIKPHFFLSILHKEKAYNYLIAYTLPLLALLIISDVVQLVLSAALRGAAEVQTVMTTRLIGTILFFIPLAYGITLLPINNHLYTFLLLYSSIHISYALMSCAYISRFKWGYWPEKSG